MKNNTQNTSLHAKNNEHHEKINTETNRHSTNIQIRNWTHFHVFVLKTIWTLCIGKTLQTSSKWTYRKLVRKDSWKKLWILCNYACKKWTWWDCNWEKQTIFKWKRKNIKKFFSNDVVALLTTCFYHVTYAFRVNLNSVVPWMSKSFLLGADTIFDIKWLLGNLNS